MPKISSYPKGTPILASDEFVIARSGVNDKILGSEFLPQQGTMRNGKISVTVAGNNLTVALKTLAGGNPSTTDPVLIYIGSAWRVVSGALSVTKNAGTNWCNAGSSELATKEIDYFAYIGFNSTDGVVIGFSRIPYVMVYSEFSTTSTNEKYAAISTITTAASGDEYVVIGRFAATLSAGAGYTWSVPAYTAYNLIQHPIYETRPLIFTPTIGYSGGASNPTSNTVNVSNYCISGRYLFIQIVSTLVKGAGNRTTTTFTIPFVSGGSAPFLGLDSITATSFSFATGCYITSGSSTLNYVRTMANDGYYFLKDILII